MGWRTRTVGPVEVEQIPGDHWTFSREPHVQVLAQKLIPHLHHSSEQSWQVTAAPSRAAGGLGPRLARALVRRVETRIRALLLPRWTRTRRAAYGPDPRQQLDIMQPLGPFRRPRRVAVVFHGGGWRGGSGQSMVYRVCQRYLARGFMVVNVEYRLGVVPASDDAIRALAWVFGNVTHFGGDSERVIVTGESAGAHLALLAAFSSARRVRGVVNFYAVTDLSSFAHARADESVRDDDGQAVLQRLSPLELVRPHVCPVLSIHGTADTMVPLDHTQRLTRRLQDAGVQTQEILVDGGNHGFEEPELDAVYKQVFRFVAACCPR
jgi:acetyl esterase/lipase